MAGSDSPIRCIDFIEAAGGQPSTRVLVPGERLPGLLSKLQEESDELRAAASPAEQGGGELADLLEVLKAIASELGQPWGEIETTAATKRAERGGFAAGVWLEM